MNLDGRRLIASHQFSKCLVSNRIIIYCLVNSWSRNCPRNQNLKFFCQHILPLLTINVSDKIAVRRLFLIWVGDITRKASPGIMVAIGIRCDICTVRGYVPSIEKHRSDLRNTSWTSVLKCWVPVMPDGFISRQHLAGELAYSRYSVRIVKGSLGLTEKYTMNYDLCLLWMQGRGEALSSRRWPALVPNITYLLWKWCMSFYFNVSRLL